MNTKRESWGTQLGFILAVAGSAIGLANIWRFPYVAGKHGGAAFVLLYLLFLFLIGFPVFMSEILIGKNTQTSPAGAFKKIGRNKFWPWAGKMTILTGFLVSGFYSAVAGRFLGYLIEALRGNLSSFQSCEAVSSHYECLMQNALWGFGFHLIFILMCILVLYCGVRNGIERANKWLMPMLFFVLILIVIRGITLPNATEGLRFLFKPDWSVLTPAAIIAALGQAFFTLSLGQGTMVTYGSYLPSNDNVLKSCIPVIFMDTAVSILSAIAVFSIVFSIGMEPTAGPGLIFNTLPWVFSQVPGGYLLGIAFFFLILAAALTSEISAMEPTIAYLIDEHKWNRHAATAACGLGAFLIGVPAALSMNLLSEYTLFDNTYLDSMDILCNNILIPLGGLSAVLLVGWVWGFPNAMKELQKGAGSLFERRPFLKKYFWFTFKFCAPALIIVVLLNAIGVLF